ncbi:hypothetical protein W97_03481 [Coniosporium apollinis CBS 100218]|uniref:Glycosyl transferase CAP10 domain-containing protein n=1 Tax=Coniosporium apollinis (strain CBS 100218) TaxID=1168221 RepID=R7YQQ1_CONA1|nr:uncharacterized protein W97_03481 [Coniosporium apollinis CBS 100218]EON64250.1 hypothetical protein W97_03481 [Coniosporium apollinis CBS 100218]
MLFAAAVCFLGETLSQDSVPPSKVAFSRLHSTLFAVPLMLFLARASLWYSHSGRVNFHPIDLLIYEGKVQHTAWLSQASASNSFFTASRKYKQRYHQPPPPNFNKWYEYASSRSAVVTDDFDNVYDDLLPFWSLSPSEIRRYTWDILSQSNNGVGGISIRDGKVDVLPGTPGTHRWMLDGAIRIIENFVEWLPDMDLALNLNDEPRVAVPYRDIEKMRRKGRQPRLVGANKITKFSDNRAGGWAPVTEEQFPDTNFEMLSFQRTFYEYGSVGCPPSSPARRQRLWDTSQLCMTCTYPHSLGQFVSNWTLSGDVCHQPDLADLHGLYLSPAAFQGSHKLFPIFSQSKAGGFNDIRFPSPWNYMDKVAYAPNEVYPDPSFRDKKVSLFWRGVTSEGVSPGTGVWKGMSRQRLVHLASNPTAPQHVLLPVSEGAKQFAYTPVAPSELKKLLSTDVHFVDPIVRCGGRDCADQAAEFGFGDKVDFQEHWGYKFLFDADGAGFSGRFLPFLQSRSLPFKSALFREWWEGRLTPWLHFVPVDLRMHGLWSTLAYFAGVDGLVGGRKVKWEPKGREAEMIAEEGREWAGKVLRKEDMEIYFFRLLLEWGRLTDDRRDELGMYIP